MSNLFLSHLHIYLHNSERSLVKQLPDDLTATIAEAEGKVHEFISARIFGGLFEGSEEKITAFWRDKNLAIDDWPGLAR